MVSASLFLGQKCNGLIQKLSSRQCNGLEKHALQRRIIMRRVTSLEELIDGFRLYLPVFVPLVDTRRSPRAEIEPLRGFSEADLACQAEELGWDWSSTASLFMASH